MSQEKYKDTINSQSSPERKKYRINFKKMGAFVLALSIGVSGVAYGIHTAFDKVSGFMDDNNLKIADILPSSEHQFDPDKLSDELISVSVAEGDTVEELCKANMTYDKEKGLDMGYVVEEVMNLGPNKKLFEGGRILQPGDELFMNASYGETKESDDK